MAVGIRGVGVAVEEVGGDRDRAGAVGVGELPADAVERRVDVAEVGEADLLQALVVHVALQALQPLAPVEVRVEEDTVPLKAPSKSALSRR